MNRPVLIAAALMGLTTLAHIIGGGRDVLEPLLGTAATDEMQFYTTLLWHFISVFLVFGTVVLAWAARDVPQRRHAIWPIALLTLFMALLFIIVGLALLGTLWIAPQWTILLVIPALALWPLARPAHG
ncbi:MAG: hypothetical protein JKX69_12195 [Rhodobacteraceae bacterium]|nr:hypothetical protein [Paracoccaceae bacterium]